jgi:hypothetical protein
LGRSRVPRDGRSSPCSGVAVSQAPAHLLHASGFAGCAAEQARFAADPPVSRLGRAHPRERHRTHLRPM